MLEADNSGALNLFVDASFAVHWDVKSHAGAAFSLGKGVITLGSTKQKVNCRSSTEAQLVGTDDHISKMSWTKLFIEHQGFEVKANVAHQDNASSSQLEQNDLVQENRLVTS